MLKKSSNNKKGIERESACMCVCVCMCVSNFQACSVHMSVWCVFYAGKGAQFFVVQE